MESGGISQDDARQVARLPYLLAAVGYADLVGNCDPLSPDPARWRMIWNAAPERLRPLLALFLLAEPVEADLLPPGFEAALQGLAAFGVIGTDAGGRLTSNGLVVLPVLGHWLICQPPQANPGLYFGEDSMALLLRMTPGTGGDYLDLCCGPGLHAIHGARFARRVTAVEISSVAVQLARVNMLLNGIADRVEVVEGDLYAPLRGRRFDWITANPPMLPYPETLRPPSIGHGGRDGLAVVERVLEGLPHALREGGGAQVIGMAFGDGKGLIAADRIRALAGRLGLDLRVTTLGRFGLRAGDPLTGALVRTLCEVSGEPVDAVHGALTEMLRQQGATHLCPISLWARLGCGQYEPVDLSDLGGGRFWLV